MPAGESPWLFDNGNPVGQLAPLKCSGPLQRQAHEVRRQLPSLSGREGMLLTTGYSASGAWQRVVNCATGRRARAGVSSQPGSADDRRMADETSSWVNPTIFLRNIRSRKGNSPEA